MIPNDKEEKKFENAKEIEEQVNGFKQDNYTMVNDYEKKIAELAIKASKDGKKQTFELMGDLLKEGKDDDEGGAFTKVY